MLNPVWLRTFKTLVEVGHFTQTAEKLFMTQPGVSQHITKLEAICGHALIKRYNKTFEVTEQGRRVYQYALKLEEQQTQLIESLGFDNSTLGECRIAWFWANGFAYLSAIISDSKAIFSINFSYRSDA
ncbi:LysR family transcriptional regulator [Psychromonas sp. KJ10-10]|uniref:LysR family transcriptional regulator n=1 Tax=Psychromonas sp. KJ10-10 TaxID=3391823 RepID=UPI0039B3F4D7